MAREINVRDPVITDLFKKRLESFKNAEVLHKMQKQYLRMAIIDANMKRIHTEDLLINVKNLIGLQREQIEKKYSHDREIEIIRLMKELSGGYWTDDEKQLIMTRRIEMQKMEQDIQQLSCKIAKVNKEFKEYQGLEIRAKLE